MSSVEEFDPQLNNPCKMDGDLRTRYPLLPNDYAELPPAQLAAIYPGIVRGIERAVYNAWATHCGACGGNPADECEVAQTLGVQITTRVEGYAGEGAMPGETTTVFVSSTSAVSQFLLNMTKEGGDGRILL